MSAELSSHGASFTLRRLTKRFGAVTAVDGIDLQASPGEFPTLLGPSGSGKTTTLNMFASGCRVSSPVVCSNGSRSPGPWSTALASC